LFFQHFHTSQEATSVGQCCVSKVFAQRQDTAVRVIGMQYRQFLLPASGVNAKANYQKEQHDIELAKISHRYLYYLSVYLINSVIP
jgi:hypothetical protein